MNGLREFKTSPSEATSDVRWSTCAVALRNPNTAHPTRLTTASVASLRGTKQFPSLIPRNHVCLDKKKHEPYQQRRKVHPKQIQKNRPFTPPSPCFMVFHDFDFASPDLLRAQVRFRTLAGACTRWTLWAPLRPKGYSTSAWCPLPCRPRPVSVVPARRGATDGVTTDLKPKLLRLRQGLLQGFAMWNQLPASEVAHIWSFVEGFVLRTFGRVATFSARSDFMAVSISSAR